MSSISSSFQDHIDAKPASDECALVLKENNLNTEKYNNSQCQSALQQISDDTCSGENDMFSLKLTQISSQSNSASDSNCQTKKEKRCSPQKCSQGIENVLEQAMGIESFVQAQRLVLIKSLAQETGSEEQRTEALNSFLDVLQSRMSNLTRLIKNVEAIKKGKKSSPVKSPGKKQSPIKSPSKKENDTASASVDESIDYGSPQGKECKRVGLSFYSPGKQSQKSQQSNRMSQQRRQKQTDEEGEE